MRKLKVLVLAFLSNPLGTNWIYGLKSLGYQVVVVDWRDSLSTREQLNNWGLKEDISVFNCYRELSEQTYQAILNSLGGEPDILFAWWGSPMLKPIQIFRSHFPNTKAVLCIDTIPNASNIITEMLEILRFHRFDYLVDGYVFYSRRMAEFFWQRIPAARRKPYLTIIEPFLKQAFDLGDLSQSEVPKLKRLNEQPHVIFTGRGDRLWSKNFREVKDAVGPFLVELAKRDVCVFVPNEADVREIHNLYNYPKFSNAEIFNGQFARYVSQFDAHLVIYNEANGTFHRRSSTGLSTRLALGMASTTPVAATKTSTFLTELWFNTPFGFVFNDVDDLATTLRDKVKMAFFRHNMKSLHQQYTFEAQSSHVSNFLMEVVECHPLIRSLETIK